MKTTVKIFIMTFLVVMLNERLSITFSQSGTFKNADLKSKTWVLKGSTDLTCEQVFKSGKIIYTMEEKTKKAVFNFEYYLSDTIITIFDSSKINKVEQGKYIISRVILTSKSIPSSPRPISVFEILELNDSKLILSDTQRRDNILEYLAK